MMVASARRGPRKEAQEPGARPSRECEKGQFWNCTQPGEKGNDTAEGRRGPIMQIYKPVKAVAFSLAGGGCL